MHFSSSIASSKRNKVMTPEQFNQVVVAITEGRYSWACVLILRFAGYNPVHFIPYRTYSRLVKENSSPNPQLSSLHQKEGRSQDQAAEAIAVSRSQSFVKVNDLSYLEAMQSSSAGVNGLRENEPQGGYFLSWISDLPEAIDLPDSADACLPTTALQSYWDCRC